MKGSSYLNSYLDPIAKVWGNVQPQSALFGKQVKKRSRNLLLKKLKNRLPKHADFYLYMVKVLVCNYRAQGLCKSRLKQGRFKAVLALSALFIFWLKT